jgi:rhamnopyranosyl-N-acetylglucosaminyl-diphospho-decaprenol beta-1,3/1,4-galactofuranosyltransferase
MTVRARIAALIVTHNRLGPLQTTLARLLAEPIDHVLVWDNASTDATAAWLGGLEDRRVATIRSPDNLGGAGGFAGAMAAARARFDPDWYLLHDDDAWPETGALAAFRARLPLDWDAVACAVHYPDGRICPMNRPLRSPFGRGPRGWRGFRLRDADFAADAVPQPVDMASFVGLFLSRAAVARAGLPDARLFLYGDDLIYTLGLTRMGGRIGFLPALRFVHDCATLAGPGGVYRPLWKVYYHHRNGILLYRLAAGWLAWPILGLRLPRWWLAARHYRRDERPVYRRLLRAAIRDGLADRRDTPPAGVPVPGGRRNP